MDTPVSAPAAPAPQAQEVPINQNPVNTPTPVGSQAPDKPPGESRREAIQRAFDKASENGAKAKPTADKAKSADDKPKPADDKPKPHHAVAQNREGGRFAPRQPAEGAPTDAQASAQAGAQPGAKHPPLAENAPHREPPQRMAEHAKADWAGTPESVRAEVGRMHHEFGEAYKQYKGDNETMNSIRHFQQMAQQHGTTLDRALSNYVGMEQKLRSDLVGGLDQIVNNLNLQTRDGQRISLRDVAYHILNQSPEQHQMVASRNSQSAMSLQLGQISQRLEQMAQQNQQLQQEVVFRHTRGAVDVFADVIENELKSGYDLETAYRRADLLRPGHAAQTRTPSAQTRPVDKSISGSPDGGPPSGAQQRQKGGKTPSRRDAIQRAMRSVNGSF
jgi:hypothetical protein